MRKVLIFTGAFLMSFGAMAQSQFILYQMNNRLPQSNQLNPSFFPDYKVTVGLPVLSATYITANTGKLTFDNAFTRSADDSLRFNPQGLATELDESNRIEINGNALLFQLGIRAKKNYFSLSLNERVDGGIVYPRTLVEFLGNGTGEENKLYAFDNLGIQAHWYHELAIGYGRQVTEKLTIGGRFKVLSGIAGINVDNVSAAFLSTIDSLHIYSAPIEIYSAGLDLFESDGNSVFNKATAFNNVGYAIDLGLNYEIIDNLILSASITDLGSINWKNDTKLVRIAEVNYSFKGEEFLDVISGETNFDAFSQMTDSLNVLYTRDTIENVSYKTPLTSTFYTGATYQLGKMHSFGALFYGDVFKGTFNPGVGLSYNLTIGHIWSIGVNASYRNKSFQNFGVGTTLTLGPIQLYALSENIMAFSQLSSANYVDARVGLNLVFGKLNKSSRSKKVKKSKNKDTNVPTIDLGF